MRTLIILAVVIFGLYCVVRNRKTDDKKKTGAENVRWDSAVLYKSIDDPQLMTDVEHIEQAAEHFHAEFKDKLDEKLGEAIEEYSKIDMLSNKVFVYLMLESSTHLSDDKIKSKKSEVRKRLAAASGKHLTFFELELARMDAEIVERLIRFDPIVARHEPWVRQVRLEAPYMLSEPVESALAVRSPYSSGAWSTYYNEVFSRLRFLYDGKDLTLAEILHELTEERDVKKREKLLKIINDVLGGEAAELAAFTLYQVSGKKQVEDKERGYGHPMDSRNRSNAMPDEVVDALHEAVTEMAGPLARRYYRLKAKHLGLDRLKWSDRNAPMPFADRSVVSWEDGKRMVLESFGSFSPTLVTLVKEQFEAKRIDAPPYEGKDNGAYNISFVLPDGTPIAWTFLNYQGSNRDVMTLAHELGHAVHGLLAGEAQGTLMSSAPMAYAETASIFAEMTTFSYLERRLEEKGDKKSLLALRMGKIDDMLNTAVRQIGFSEFEKILHASDQRLSVKELNDAWMSVVRVLYGEDGDVFIYRDMEYLWVYVHHFHRPFYVYAYACGELLTQSLYAKKDQLGDRFEPLYLELLRAGGTKNIVELLMPFGLDPTTKEFWEAGIEISLGRMVKEAEDLTREIDDE